MSAEEIRNGAEQERGVLIQQAMRDHAERVTVELRRFAQEMAHIQDVYVLRLSVLQLDND